MPVSRFRGTQVFAIQSLLQKYLFARRWQIPGQTQGAVWRLPLLPFPSAVSLVFLAAAYFLLLVYFEITPEAPSSGGE